MAEPNAMPNCPMASMCKGMAEKPPPLAFMAIPGIALILVGVLILVEPAILVWLVAAMLIHGGYNGLAVLWSIFDDTPAF